MAEPVEHWPRDLITPLDVSANAESSSIYDWAKWFDGRIWRLTQGVDFSLGLVSFRSSATKAATRAGASLRSAIVGNDLYLQTIESSYRKKFGLDAI